MLVEIFVASIGQVPNRVCLTTMVPALGAERTSVELRASLADRGTSVFLDGSVEVLRALGSRSKANELGAILEVLLRSRRWRSSGYNRRYACVGVGKRGRTIGSLFLEANDGAIRGRCSVDATLAVEEAFPTRRLRRS